MVFTTSSSETLRYSVFKSVILFRVEKMAAQFFNRVGQLGLTVAIAGGMLNSALYNGEFACFKKKKETFKLVIVCK